MDSKDSGDNNRMKAVKAAAKKAREQGYIIGKDGRHMHPNSVAALSKRTSYDYDKLTPEQRKAWHQQGQKGSTIAQARRRTIKDIYNDLLTITLTPNQTANGDDLTAKAQDIARNNGKSLTQYDAVALSMLAEAQAGNVKAAAFVRDSVGDKPADVQQIEANILTDNDKALIDKLAKKAGLTNPTDEKQRNNDNK